MPERRPAGAPAEDLLPYVVERLDDAGGAVQRLAMCASASLGYAAYYAALREYPSCEVVLRCGARVLSRGHL